MMRRSLASLAAVAAVLVTAGCGIGPGDSADGSKLVVTDDFGTRSLLDLPQPKVGGSDTVMRFLERNAKVSTKYGGGFVQSIDGQSGGTPGGRPTDWFYYVNGLLADKGAASVKLRTDDSVWWDRHDWGGGETKAVVGAFPEPFKHGLDGRKLPIRVECINAQSKACEGVQDTMTKLGILTAKGSLQSSFTKDTLRILVGTYSQISADGAVRSLEQGPKKSGVYAKPSADGSKIALLNAKGQTTQTLGAGSGLIAATVFEDGQPVWMVTGTDQAGVDAAASVLDEGDLKNRFALAISDDRGIPVPTP